MKKKEEKSWFQKILNTVIKFFIKAKWVFLCLFIAIIFAINVAILSFVENPSNWLTLYSGWLSAIATSIIGLIALWQGKKYKKESDIILKRQIMASNVEKEIAMLDGIKNELEIHLAWGVLSGIFIRNHVGLRQQKVDYFAMTEEINNKIFSLASIKSKLESARFAFNEKLKLCSSFDAYFKIAKEKREIVFHCTKKGNETISCADLRQSYVNVKCDLKKYIINVKNLHANILDYSIEYEHIVEEYNKSICIVQNGWKA